jgi:hypothetical protein
MQVVSALNLNRAWGEGRKAGLDAASPAANSATADVSKRSRLHHLQSEEEKEIV